MGVALGVQPLKSPQSDTWLASGLWRAKRTPGVLGAVGFAVDAATEGFSVALGGADWTGGGDKGAVAWGDGFGAMAVTGAFCGNVP